MCLTLKIQTETELLVCVDGDCKRYYPDDQKMTFLCENGRDVTVQIRQAEEKRKWYFAPFYLIEGLFLLAALYGADGYFAIEHLCPYLHACSFVIHAQQDTTVLITAKSSAVDANYVVEEGLLQVQEHPDIVQCKETKKINSATFHNAMSKVVYAVFSLFSILSVIFSLLVIYSDVRVAVKISIGAFWLLLLGVLVWKILSEKRELSKFQKWLQQ